MQESKRGLQINVKFTGIEHSDSVTDYIEKKVNSLEKLLSDAERKGFFEVEIGTTSRRHKAGDIFKAEINFNAGELNLRAVAEEEDLFAALDSVKDQLARELTHAKTKKMTMVRRGGAMIKNMIKGISRRG